MSHFPEKREPRSVSILLHAHLPYGLRAGKQTSLEEAWLFEAVTHSYLPLLAMIRQLPRKESPWLTVSLSPTLLELWSHPEFAKRYRAHLQAGCRIIDSESQHPGYPAAQRALAREILAEWDRAAEAFAAIEGKLPAALSHLAKSGKVELITTAATHPFLPAFQNDPAFRKFQIGNGIETFKRHTGIAPKGFWLPECAYFDGLEEDLAPFGIEYFGLEEQGLTRANPPASIRRPMACPNGLLALGRDGALSQKVWSARSGYPGHPDYREFHHDGIHQVEAERCVAYALPDGGRLPFGLKYWRVTGKPEKDWYAPERAKEQARHDAGDFTKQLEAAGSGLVFLPFDAELFGHWWFEGPLWLETVLRGAAELTDTCVQSAHAAARSIDAAPASRPAASTWGRKGDYSFWVNRETDWIYPLLSRCSRDLQELLRRHGPPDGRSEMARTLRQAGRELLLASASDWPFMLRAGTTVDYAMQRLRRHIKRFHFLAQSMEKNHLSPADLQLLEELNPAFEEISFTAYTTDD